MLSPFMRSKVERENTNLRETVVQTFNGKQLLLLTETVKFYLEKGFIIENISSFIQYRGEKVLEKFVQTITDGRVKAINEKQKEYNNYCTLDEDMLFCFHCEKPVPAKRKCCGDCRCIDPRKKKIHGYEFLFQD